MKLNFKAFKHLLLMGFKWAIDWFILFGQKSEWPLLDKTSIVSEVKET